MTPPADPHPPWDESYAGDPPPWDVGHPQPAFVRLAEAGMLTGALLDAGCGTGEHTLLAASHGAEAVGVDVSPRAITAARRKAEERHLAARFEVVDALDLDHLGQTFDTVVDCGLFHVFDDETRTGYVTSLSASLRPGGRLHLMCFSDRQPGDRGPRRITEDALRGAFDAGWRFESLTPDRFDLNANFGDRTGEAWLATITRLDE